MIRLLGNGRLLSESCRFALLAMAALGSAPAMAQTGAPADADPNDVSAADIVVTAQKRTERLLDVPASITALKSDALLSNNQTSLQDYYASVPGLNLTTDANGSAQIAIRGITTGPYAGNPPSASLSMTYRSDPRRPMAAAMRRRSTWTRRRCRGSKCCAAHRERCTARAAWADC